MEETPKVILKYICEYAGLWARVNLSKCSKKLNNKIGISKEELSNIIISLNNRHKYYVKNIEYHQENFGNNCYGCNSENTLCYFCAQATCAQCIETYRTSNKYYMMLSDCREGSYLYVNKQTGTKENYIVVCNNCHMLFDEKKSITCANCKFDHIFVDILSRTTCEYKKNIGILKILCNDCNYVMLFEEHWDVCDDCEKKYGSQYRFQIMKK